MSHKKVEEVFLNNIENIEKLSEIENINDIEQDEEDFSNIEHLKKRLLEIDNKKKEVMNLFMANSIRS